MPPRQSRAAENPSRRKKQDSPITKVVPTFPVASASRNILSDVKVENGKLIVPFESHEDLLAKLSHLSTHLIDAKNFAASPAITPSSSPSTIPYPDAQKIVTTCAKSDDWSISVGDCVPDIDIFRACLARKIQAKSYSVPDLTEFNAKSTLDDVLNCVLEAAK